jgi:stage V sporulation protein SpoVS
LTENQLLETGQLLSLLETAVAQAKEAVLITSAVLEPPGPEILFVNPAFSEMTGTARKTSCTKHRASFKAPNRIARC